MKRGKVGERGGGWLTSIGSLGGDGASTVSGRDLNPKVSHAQHFFQANV